MLLLSARYEVLFPFLRCNFHRELYLPGYEVDATYFSSFPQIIMTHVEDSFENTITFALELLIINPSFFYCGRLVYSSFFVDPFDYRLKLARYGKIIHYRAALDATNGNMRIY